MNIRKLIGAGILAGATIAGAYALGCGEDELANKLRNRPTDEIIDVGYDAGSMIPDFGVVTDSGVKQDSGDGGQPPQDSGFDAGYADMGLADIYSWDAGFEDVDNDAGSSDIDYADAYTFDGEFPDTQAEDAGSLEDVLNADAEVSDAETLDAAADAGSEDGSVDAGSQKPVISYTLNGEKVNYVEIPMDQSLAIQATATSPKGQSIGEYCADLEGYINSCAGNGQSIIMDGWPVGDYNYALGITACDNDGECTTEQAHVYVQP